MFLSLFYITNSALFHYRMTPPFTMIGSSVATVEKSKHKDFPEGVHSFSSSYLKKIVVLSSFLKFFEDIFVCWLLCMLLVLRDLTKVFSPFLSVTCFVCLFTPLLYALLVASCSDVVYFFSVTFYNAFVLSFCGFLVSFCFIFLVCIFSPLLNVLLAWLFNQLGFSVLGCVISLFFYIAFVW